MKKILFIMLILIFSCSSNDENSNIISDAELNQIGNKLAEWGNSNCAIININNKEILWQGPNAGGCSTVYFEFTGTFDPLNFEEREDFVQDNLRNLINKSNCNISELKNNILNITSNSTNDIISKHLECLGTIEILEGVFGSE